MKSLAATLLLVIGGPLSAAEWPVAPGESIAAAVQAAKPGDTIRVQRGYYAEHLVIDKPLRLVGINNPTLSGGEKGDVIRVKSPDVTIKGFIVRDSGADLTAQNAGIYVEPGSHRIVIRHNVLVYNLFGIWLEKLKDPEVSDNLITGKRDLSSARRGNGIQLYNTSGAKIIGNHISFARDGIYVDVSHHAVFRGNRMHHLRYGSHYMNSNDNLWEDNESYLNRGGLALMEVRRQTVRNNRAWGNTDHGIMLRTIQDSVIENNVVAGNGRGFFIYDAEYNVLKGNRVIGNRVGAHVWAGSIHNDVDGNDFIQNREQVHYVASRDELWGKGKGNYWSNYAGWDANGDGTGDVPYEANDLVDRLTWKYPLVKLLLNSPAVHSLRLIARQFPLLRSPSIVDQRPRMQPLNPDWSQWIDRTAH
ncbi:nitrous oxide reductase family maturation protein NosD [Dechloromonas sp. XY25]|uniref:Nitrous oxide reductase family maturation protein NosD n=1 Tax=Dechloromonas hankyongensis TaxID=2908002 RepID=A0ABS9JZ95_9RHOO|nr:nitrous oxide reductase family maturation protein NosD [Dechloromonas hankyongensis]MCG2576225.1 nitrous oxide reductase family maturation protein NosD [Dechloromonas hankyongensis]